MLWLIDEWPAGLRRETKHGHERQSRNQANGDNDSEMPFQEPGGPWPIVPHFFENSR
ncbi:hypothetical protein OHD62_23635 [Mesorhizobium sp. YC-39]|uniref:hypothetical protein n=1 Tax=unclassified Mesorhizobium TaxID=325217 RepID=UPI0021E98B8A|nr:MULTISPECIES: hypothetical protein [unclassified Mesorhizobium]MCV3209274.1 hypothetical protein [Mesorhizobium sp. YC-2]MCV3231376.1 hypothetical protein [Mesorhizobium sp. YC-39]